jgi:predicted Zn-dependent protease
MSGWRSGSGRDQGGPTFVHPADRIVPPTGQRLGNLVAVGCLVILAAILATTAWYQASLRPPHRILPAPVTDTVVLVPIGPFPDDRLRDLPGDYAAEYGLHLTVAEPIPVDPTAWSADRRQYSADRLARSAAEAAPSGAAKRIVIAVTAADLYIEGVPWNWAFALRRDDRTAVISVFRMPNLKTMNRWTLFRKMLTRELGFLAWQLPPTDNPYDLLVRDVLSAFDLDRVSDHL